MPAPWFASTIDAMTPIGFVDVNNGGPVTSSRGVLSSTALAGAQSPVLPNRDAGSAGFSIRGEDTLVSEGKVELLGSTDSDRIRLWKTSPGVFGTEYRVEYWDGSAWVVIGSPFEIDLNFTWYQVRIEWSGYGTSSGSVSYRVFLDAGESLISSGSASGLNFTSLTGIVRMRYLETFGTVYPSLFSTAFVADDNGDSSYVYTSVADDDGADTGGTGDFNSINSTGSTYDSTFISLPVSGDRRSVKNTVARDYDNRTVRAVSVNVRLRRGATGPTDADVYLTIGGVRYYHPTTLTLTTSFESYCMVWETDPSTSAAWSLTNAQAASLEWGVEAV
jgi:hypothetical protein